MFITYTNPFWPNIPFLYFLKKVKNLKFSDFFKGLQKRNNEIK